MLLSQMILTALNVCNISILLRERLLCVENFILGIVLFQDVGGKSFHLRSSSLHRVSGEHFSNLPGMSLTRMLIMTEHLLLLASKDSFSERVWAVRLRTITGEVAGAHKNQSLS